ncbi:hypothetical protein BBJ28_00003360 [Nothophytophthora sp. Chile5]|nr:hypothetical protein BBJ28_00003360 [Nothophytophthora sp. Chile5]
MELLRHRRKLLYFITPSVGARVAPEELPQIVESAIRGGAGLIQWRQKPSDAGLEAMSPLVQAQWKDRGKAPFLLDVARRIREVTRKFKVLLVVNDSVDLALEIGADGVHVGQTDASLADVAGARGDALPWIVGVTVRDAPQAKAACEGGATYLGVGPVFTSSTKPEANDGATIDIDGLRACSAVARQYDVPVYAIGGLSLKERRIQRCIQEGDAAGVCAIAAISDATDRHAAAADIVAELARL